ncbi:hypothetical protein [Sphingobium sp.]|uniref:hypothetical protein n=1 Tax=Sphingobium sp. TaxID=1912891 RepID=UPI0028BEE9A9|nr:hypothetical protein [Sphingobium sp.]
MRLPDLSFPDWIEHAFSHEVRLHGNGWFFDMDAPWWDPAPGVAVDYLTRLFADPLPALQWFSDAQIAQGLTYLMNTSASGDSGWLYSREVPAAERQHCIEAIAILFEQIFAPRAAPVLSHIDEPGGNALNIPCYMWFDVMPSVALADDPDKESLHRALLGTMERILKLENIACQEAALHGLGHLASAYPDEAVVTVDRYLNSGGDKRPELAAYARAARCGCVQ